MRRKTKIVLAITFMIAVLVSGFSYLYISQVLRQRVNSASELAILYTAQLASAAANAVPDLSSTRVDTSDPAAVRAAIAEYCAGLPRPEAEALAWASILEEPTHAGCAACGMQDATGATP